MSALAMALAATGMAAAAVRALSPQRQARPPADVAVDPGPLVLLLPLTPPRTTRRLLLQLPPDMDRGTDATATAAPAAVAGVDVDTDAAPPAAADGAKVAFADEVRNRKKMITRL